VIFLLWSRPSILFNGFRRAFPGIKRWVCEADHTPPSISEVKNAWSYTSTPRYLQGVVLNQTQDAFMALYLSTGSTLTSCFTIISNSSISWRQHISTRQGRFLPNLPQARSGAVMSPILVPAAIDRNEWGAVTRQWAVQVQQSSGIWWNEFAYSGPPFLRKTILLMQSSLILKNTSKF
jgi:hypothetical protein